MGQDEQTRVIEVALPNGAVALVRAPDLDGPGGGAIKTALPTFDLAEIGATLEGVVDAVRSAVDRARPDELTVQLGLELVVKSGKLSALIVEGGGKATLSVALKWKHAPRPT